MSASADYGKRLRKKSGKFPKHAVGSTKSQGPSRVADPSRAWVHAGPDHDDAVSDCAGLLFCATSAFVGHDSEAFAASNANADGFVTRSRLPARSVLYARPTFGPVLSFPRVLMSDRLFLFLTIPIAERRTRAARLIRGARPPRSTIPTGPATPA